MRKMLVLVCVTAATAAAVLIAGVGTVGAYLSSGPDISIAGGGYTLANPAGANVESNRERFEYALRQSQTTGVVYGKGVTLRGQGPSRTATDGSGFTGTTYVARAWTSSGNIGYPGLPPDPGDGATVDYCGSFLVAGQAALGLQGFFVGQFDVYLVEANGTTEHNTGITFRALYAINEGTSSEGSNIAYYFVDDANNRIIATAPFNLPGADGYYQKLTSGSTGVKDGVQSPLCA